MKKSALVFLVMFFVVTVCSVQGEKINVNMDFSPEVTENLNENNEVKEGERQKTFLLLLGIMSVVLMTISNRLYLRGKDNLAFFFSLLVIIIPSFSIFFTSATLAPILALILIIAFTVATFIAMIVGFPLLAVAISAGRSYEVYKVLLIAYYIVMAVYLVFCL